MKWTEVIAPMIAGGIVENERQLSLLAGGTESLVSTSKARDRDISAEALVRLLVELEDIAQDFEKAIMSGDQAVSRERKQLGHNAFLLKGYLWENLRGELRNPRQQGGEP